MKKLIACLMAASLGHAIAEEELVFDILATLQGRVYTNAKVVQKDAARIRVMHETGIASIMMTKLPDEIREQLNYDPIAADKLLVAEARHRAAKIREARLFERWRIHERELSRQLLTKEQQDMMTDFSQRFAMLRAWISHLQSKGWADNRLQLVIDAAFERKAVVGMSQRLVEASIGLPSETESELTETGIVDVWIYKIDAVRSQECRFEDGMLVSTQFEEREVPPQPVVVLKEQPKEKATGIEKVVEQPIIRVETPIITRKTQPLFYPVSRQVVLPQTQVPCVVPQRQGASRPVVLPATPVPFATSRQGVSRPVVIPATPDPCAVPQRQPLSRTVIQSSSGLRGAHLR